MLQASRLAAVTGRTISAAMSRTPTIRIDTATVVAASTATTRFRKVIGTPATRALLIQHQAGERPVEKRDRRQAANAEHRDDSHVLPGDRQDRPEEEGEQVDIERPGRRDEHDAACDPRVEDERQSLVGRGLSG